MHYKRTAAMLKIVHRAKGRMEQILLDLSGDVMRNPTKYSTSEKIQFYEFLANFYNNQLEGFVAQQAAHRALKEGLDSTRQRYFDKNSDIP
jgi:hypothetical protein